MFYGFAPADRLEFAQEHPAKENDTRVRGRQILSVAIDDNALPPNRDVILSADQPLVGNARKLLPEQSLPMLPGIVILIAPDLFEFRRVALLDGEEAVAHCSRIIDWYSPYAHVSPGRSFGGTWRYNMVVIGEGPVANAHVAIRPTRSLPNPTRRLSVFKFWNFAAP